MPPTIPELNWISLDQHFKARFQANVEALATRYPKIAGELMAWVPSRSYCIHVAGAQLLLGADGGGGIQALPTILSPAAATATVDKMFPSGNYKVALVAGEDLGWMWNRLYRLPCAVPNLPGFRPPMFFLMKDLERLQVILHIQDWRDLLADRRVRFFLGEHCVQHFRQSLLDDLTCPWPTVWVTVNPDIWPPGFTIESALAEARASLDAEQASLNARQALRARSSTRQDVAARFTSGRPLKVLGITSRYTSFLQHSMRDWLDAFARSGHTIRLEIESADHELSNTLVVARACAEFDPDLIVSIDHYRKSLAGVAADVPVVMWIQDALPALFNTEAGAAQGPLDFSMSIDPLKMVHEFGYPANRMMSALIGVNENRFTTPAVHGAALAQYACDVCFVSHASTPAEVLLNKYLSESNSDFATRFWKHLFDNLKSIYDAGNMVTNPIVLNRLVDQSMREMRVTIRPDQRGIVDFVLGGQINNAFFRHQSLQWLADAGVNLHLYGNGWEQHPTLGRFARGPADNKTALADIYRTSKINLHISPHGAVHQRVMEGLASGGFFMLRYCAGDMTERWFKTIWDFCQARQITTDQQLQEQSTPEIQTAIAQVIEILQESPFEGRWSFMESLRSAEQNGYVRSAASIWGDHYDAVAWKSGAELIQKVQHYLQDDLDRQQRAQAMRNTVLERFTYVQTARRLVDFVRDGLGRDAV